MSSFPGSPRLLKGGLVLVDPVSGAVQRTIPLQYNPETVTRTLAPQAVTGDTANHAEALRLKGPPIETIKLEAQFDATDRLEFPDRNPSAVESGIHADLAALEVILYPDSGQLQQNHDLAALGTLELAPTLAPLTLFVWSAARVVPVRITEFSVVEEAFDPALNPIRAKVSLTLRVLSVHDLGFGGKGGSLFMLYHQSRERFARAATAGIGVGALGLSSPP